MPSSRLTPKRACRTASPSRSAASACIGLRAAMACAGSGSGATGSCGSATASSTSRSTSASMTPVETPACFASSPLGKREAALRRQDDAAARRRQPVAGVAGEADAVARPLGLGPVRIADRHPRHHAARGQRVAGDPVDEAAERRADRRPVMLRAHRLEIGAAAHRRIGIGIPDDPQRLAGAERHRHEIAGLQVEVFGRAVAVAAVERQRHEHVDDARGPTLLGRGRSEEVVEGR